MQPAPNLFPVIMVFRIRFLTPRHTLYNFYQKTTSDIWVGLRWANVQRLDDKNVLVLAMDKGNSGHYREEGPAYKSPFQEIRTSAGSGSLGQLGG